MYLYAIDYTIKYDIKIEQILWAPQYTKKKKKTAMGNHLYQRTTAYTICNASGSSTDPSS